MGSAPISPIYPEMWKRPGITPDDMVLYGSKVLFFVKPSKNDDLAVLAKELVTENSPFFGKSFYEIFKEADFRFEKIDRTRYTCACVTVYDLLSGKIYFAGRMYLDIIKKLSRLI